MAGRGEFTPIVAAEMEKFLGRPGTLRELRLIPYIGYVIQNEQVIRPERINQEERSVLSVWRADGHIVGGMSGLQITYPFWLFLQRIIWLAYIGHEEQETALAEMEKGA